VDAPRIHSITVLGLWHVAYVYIITALAVQSTSAQDFLLRAMSLGT
jgi:hypothetical protein